MLLFGDFHVSKCGDVFFSSIVNDIGSSEYHSFAVLISLLCVECFVWNVLWLVVCFEGGVV